MESLVVAPTDLGHPDHRLALETWLATVDARLGRAALNDEARRAIKRQNSIGLVASFQEASTPAGFALIQPPLVTSQRPSDVAVVDLVVLPGDYLPLVTDQLLTEATAIADGQGWTLRLWISHATDNDDGVLGGHGFIEERTLLQMRVRLPLNVTGRTSDALPCRPFRVGSDETAWLRANNRAFADHPEQGQWSRSTLEERLAEPWFDASGFLLLDGDAEEESEQRLSAHTPDVAAWCWTRIHGEGELVMGEIYVIGVDPAWQGRGLGRALAIAGLDHLAAQGVTIGMLYVDASNDGAVGLYHSLGFETDHVDRAYRRTPAR